MARKNWPCLSFTAARTSNSMVPSRATPLGATYSSRPSKRWSRSAPTEMLTGMPSFRPPTSDSSTRPWKIMSFMSAMAAMVVPSLKLFASMTLPPSLTGISSTIPSTVERTRFETLPDFLEAPSRTSCRLFSAASTSCSRSLKSSSCWT